MTDIESAVAATAGQGTSIYTVTRDSKEAQVIVPGGVGGVALATAVTVGVSALPSPASALSHRKALAMTNNGTATIYVGGSGVTTVNGTPIVAGDGPIPFDLAAGCVLYAISGTAGQDVRVLEAS